MLHYYHDNHIIFHTKYNIFALCTKRARSERGEQEEWIKKNRDAGTSETENAV